MEELPSAHQGAHISGAQVSINELRHAPHIRLRKTGRPSVPSFLVRVAATDGVLFVDNTHTAWQPTFAPPALFANGQFPTCANSIRDRGISFGLLGSHSQSL